MANSMLNSKHSLFIVVQYLTFCFQAHAVPYDSSFTSKCLTHPLPPQYDGGIVAKSEGWKPSFQLQVGMHHVISAWVKVSNGKAKLAAILKTETGDITVGRVTARTGCYSMLKGGLTAKTSGPAELYFATNNTELGNIWIDSFSVQPFTNQEWKSHQLSSIKKVRKNNVRVQVLDMEGRPLSNATVSLTQTTGAFPFGCAINANILHNTEYQNWFLSRFRNRFTVFENELKWYSTENNRGVENYTTADALFKFAESNNIKVRGHNVFWDVYMGQPYWVHGLSKEELLGATTKRINSVMRRYTGKVIHWDVVNENLHGSFFEDKLEDHAASAKFYQMAQSHDPNATLFMNEYNTIEYPQDNVSSPHSYIERINEMRSQGFSGTLGVGLEGHFGDPDLVAIRTSLEQIACSGNGPIWITELDVKYGSAEGYAKVLPELHSNPAVEGILLWSAWNPYGCYVACLTDNNFKNLPAGDVVDNFLAGLSHAEDLELRGRRTDANGFVEVWLHHGVYELDIKSPNSSFGRSNVKRINVRAEDRVSHVHRVNINHMY